jgi:hypothetical protein
MMRLFVCGLRFFKAIALYFPFKYSIDRLPVDYEKKLRHIAKLLFIKAHFEK